MQFKAGDQVVFLNTMSIPSSLEHCTVTDCFVTAGGIQTINIRRPNRNTISIHEPFHNVTKLCKSKAKSGS